MDRFAGIFGTAKPVIGMVDLGALPGAPLYHQEAGIFGLVEWTRPDLRALQSAGFDAVMLGDENDRLHELGIDRATDFMARKLATR